MKNLVVIFVVLSIFAAVVQCQHQKQETIGKVGSKTLIGLVSHSGLTWVDAKAACEKLNMHLVSLENPDENDLVHKWLLKRAPTSQITHAWAGGSRQTDGSWIWVADDKPVIYNNWQDGEPSTAKYSKCLYISPSSKWTATYCDEITAVPICQA